MRIELKRKRVARSAGGDFVNFFLLVIAGMFTALPLVLVIVNAFKPLNEFFYFPIRFYVRNPTLDNFRDLFLIMAESWVPISRYFFNTVFISVVGTVGHVLVASAAAFALAKHRFPGRDQFFYLVILALMFVPQVTAIPNYLTMSALRWVDTYAAIIVPAWAMPLGLFLMKQFMEQIDTGLLEAARIDGAGEFRVFWHIMMPNVKPAWLTLAILCFQQLWNEWGGRFIYSEHLKPLPYALFSISAGGIARQGVGAAVMLIMMSVPVIFFIISQSQIVQTMGTAGIEK